MNFSGFNRLATEISSSISSQWIPIPPPINSHSLLCFSVALKSRGNHTSGTDTVRPSSSTTVKASLEHETSTASFHEGHHLQENLLTLRQLRQEARAKIGRAHV